MIVISGITSGLGIALAKRLVSRGYRVKGFARRAHSFPSQRGVEVVCGDLLDPEFVHSVTEGATGIVHLAALSSPWGAYSDFYQVNVEGTSQLIEGARRHGVARFVQVSTPSIYFDYTDRLNIKESDPLPRLLVNNYAKTKKLAEDLALSFPGTVAIRPRAIFGPHDQALLPRVLRVCKERGMPLFRNESPLVDLTYVDNVAEALVLALEAPDSCCGEAFNITNGQPVLLYPFLERLMEQMNLPVRKRKIPLWLAHSASHFAEMKSRLTNKEPTLTRYGVGVMSCSQVLSIEKAKKWLGYAPKITMNEGVDRYVKWFQAAQNL